MNMNDQNKTDLLLIFKLSQGDQLAFKSLFEKYRNQLFTYLYKITKSAETSEEIVLDVFLKMWDGRELAPGIENFNSFLYRVAHNKAIDFLRSVKNNPLMQTELWEAMQEQISGEAADANLMLKNTEDLLNNAIGNLSPQRQKVFILHHHHGFTNDEIAKKLSLSKNTVRNHLFASFEFIRKFVSAGLELVILFCLI
ncbi:MAG: RNA polymerase sigma-70 factor [Ferruginibacter sp.]|nr:RNA polymerase sigma-70 factor [Ferruginibacter sp.]